MRFIETDLPGVLILEPKVFEDDRGFFMESWNLLSFKQATKTDVSFVQDNHSRSVRNVLRGLHYQVVRPQGKLVRVVSGRVIDVAVDLRKSSDRFGQWVAVELTAENRRQLWIPAGFAHGFLVCSESADFLYKTTEYWMAEHDRCVAWNDPQLNIDWPYSGNQPILAARDASAPLLRDAELFD